MSSREGKLGRISNFTSNFDRFHLKFCMRRKKKIREFWVRRKKNWQFFWKLISEEEILGIPPQILGIST